MFREHRRRDEKPRETDSLACTRRGRRTRRGRKNATANSPARQMETVAKLGGKSLARYKGQKTARGETEGE